MKKISLVLILTLLIGTGIGAEVSGTVYRWSDLETVPAIIQVTEQVNGEEVTHQEVLNETGRYSIELEEGEYTFKVHYNNLTASENLVLAENDSRTIDFALTPDPEQIFPVEPLPEYDEYGEILPPEDYLIEDNVTEENVTDPEEDEDYDPIIGEEEVSDLVIYLSILVLAVMISLTYFLKKRSEAAKGEDYTSSPKEDEGDKSEKRIKSDEEEVLEVLKEMEGEAYQSEIREKIGFSASKTSELLTKLEKKEKIDRSKKGREKIVRLKE